MKRLRTAIDIAMTVTLIGLMSYSLIGELTHEILGTVMIILFVIHHILNRRWFGALTKGIYPIFRVFQTSVFILMLITFSVFRFFRTNDFIFYRLYSNHGTVCFFRILSWLCVKNNRS